MQPNNQQNNPADKPGASVNLRPDIVANIPLKTQSAPINPIADDDDLDKIMQDVGKDLSKVGDSPHKKRFFEFKRRPKTPKPAPRPKAVRPQPAKPAAKPAPLPMPAKQGSVPALAITVAIIVTGVLIAAAYSAYK